MRQSIVAAWLLCLVSTGCAVREVQSDQDRMRAGLMELYTNQIMDNVIRTYNCMPIMQIDYTNAQGMVTVTGTASIGENQAVTNTTLTNLPALTQAVTRSIVTTITGSLGFTNSNQMTLSAAPVITANEVYDSYVAFVFDKDAQGNLVPSPNVVVTDEPPPPGAAHICRKYCKRFYWIPMDRRFQFFNLALVTTAQRGKPLEGPVFFQANATSVAILEGSRPAGDPNDPTLGYLVTLDQLVPNDDSGTITFVDPSKSTSQTDGSKPAALSSPAARLTSWNAAPVENVGRKDTDIGSVVATFAPHATAQMPGDFVVSVSSEETNNLDGSARSGALLSIAPSEVQQSDSDAPQQMAQRFTGTVPAPPADPASSGNGGVAMGRGGKQTGGAGSPTVIGIIPVTVTLQAPTQPQASAIPLSGRIATFYLTQAGQKPARTRQIIVELKASQFKQIQSLFAKSTSGTVAVQIKLDHYQPRTLTAEDLLQTLAFEARQTNQILARGPGM